jgi:hypothetical protein
MNGVLPHSNSTPAFNGNGNGMHVSSPNIGAHSLHNNLQYSSPGGSPNLDARLLHNKVPFSNPGVHASDITFSSVRGTKSTRTASDAIEIPNGLSHSISGNALNHSIPEEDDEGELTDEQKLALTKTNKSMTSSDVKMIQREKALAERKAKVEAEKRAKIEQKKKEDAERAAQLEKTIMLAGTKL